jgi:hypothetical protein
MNKTSHPIEEDSYGFFTKLYCFLHIKRVCKVDLSVCSCISTCSMLNLISLNFAFRRGCDVVQYIVPYSYVFRIVNEIIFANMLIQYHRISIGELLLCQYENNIFSLTLA